MFDMTTGTPKRRLKCVETTAELILQMLRIPESGRVVDGETIHCVDDKIPETAKISGVYLDPYHPNLFGIQIEDESFDEIGHGERVPLLSPQYTRNKISGSDVTSEVCDACGKAATSVVVDIMTGVDAEGWRTVEPNGTHRFCEQHYRDTIFTPKCHDEKQGK